MTENLPVPREEWTPAWLAKLAREVAMEIKTHDMILAQFGITEAQYAKIAALPFFQQTVKTFAVEWNSALSTSDRVRIQALTNLEAAMPILGAKMMTPDGKLAEQVEAGKFFAKVSGLDTPKPLNSAEKFVININLGADTNLRFEKDITPTSPPIEVHPLSEGEGAATPEKT